MHLSNPARRAALAALGAALAFTFAHPTPSHASGTYVHHGCVTSDDVADASGGWRSFASVTDSGVGPSQLCGQTGGRLQLDMFPAGGVAPGAGTGWTYTAPPGTTIERVAASYAGLTNAWTGTSQGVIQLIDATGHKFLNFNGNVSPAHRNVIDYDTDTASLTWRLICDPIGGTCGGSVGWAALYEPRLFLADATPPLGGFSSGSLTTDSTLVGDERLSYSASDTGGGVARLRVYVDGAPTSIDHVVDDNDGRCRASGSEQGAWVFSAPRPCPTAVSADETIDTTKIADGRHAISVKVVDAAQQETTIWSGERLVANHPPVNLQLPSFRDNAAYANPLVGKAIEALNDGTWTGPGLTVVRNWAQCDAHGSLTSCAAIPGATGLSYTPTAADVGHRLRLMVTATNVAASVQIATAPTGIIATPSSATGLVPKPVAADGDPAADAPPPLPIATVATQHTLRGRVVGEAAGAGCPQDKATLKFEHVSGGKLKLGHGRTSTAQLQLTCTNNDKPIEGAALDVVTREGSRPTVASDTVTDGAGHAVLRLAGGPSRAISVGYRMYADDPIARATATLKVSVNSHVRLRGNHRHLHNGKALTLTGRLLGGRIPTRGVTLTVQWKDHHRWRPLRPDQDHQERHLPLRLSLHPNHPPHHLQAPRPDQQGPARLPLPSDRLQRGEGDRCSLTLRPRPSIPAAPRALHRHPADRRISRHRRRPRRFSRRGLPSGTRRSTPPSRRS